MHPTPDDLPTGDMPPSDDSGGGTTERYRRAGGGDASDERPGGIDALGAMPRVSVRRAGQRVAGFELVDRIDKDANNAFGEVWLARRVEPFQRVAIKFLRRDRVNDELVRRFSRAESKALARFNHPYIARFYELGFDGDTPYLVMQYVPGDRITAYCDKQGLPVRARLELMAKVCDAVQHVHLQGVVHRDLKPANILVSEARPDAEDARHAGESASAGKAPIPVLIDFGVAKSVNPDAPLASAVVSGIGGFAGTYAYAAPEQIKQKRDEDTGRQADIYALGAVLFELIVGVSPMEHVLSDTTLSGPERALRLANDERPSMADAYAKLASERQREVAAQRGTTVEAMKRLLRSRLAHIADRALRSKPTARFSDARAFALDIANYLADRDFAEAAAEPRLEKWRRTLRRNRAAFAGVAGVIVALTVGLGFRPASDAYREWSEWRRMHAYEVLAQDPDPAVVTDTDARERIKATGKPWKIRHTASGIVMLLCPPGEFLMGSPESEVGRHDGETQHKRVIRSAFYLSQFEVSKAEWRAIAGKDAGYFKGDDLPVESVSWNMIHENFLAPSRDYFRLPSEAEWEYACRAGTTTAYSFGDTITKEQARFGGDGPASCGKFPANRWGFHDMHGNVYEWVEDVYADYPKDGGTEEAVATGGTSDRVLRGGSWGNGSDNLRSSIRDGGYAPGYTDLSFGFRVARAPL